MTTDSFALTGAEGRANGDVRSGPQDPAASAGTACSRTALGLRAGEWVQVRPIEDILATLDDDGSLDGLPFMPEMVQYCGRRFRVHKSAHKTCDTIDQYVIRRMKNAVHLDDLRCDGASHNGCQAGCLLFWKEAWLQRAAAPERDRGNSRDRNDARAQPQRAAPDSPMPEAPHILHRGTRAPADESGEERYRCQATELLRATSEVRRRDRWNPIFYVRDLTSGNVPLRTFIRYGLFAMANALMLRWRGYRYPRLYGLAGSRTPDHELNLVAGELVRVRSKREIMRTLNPGLRNRGLWFDVEMLPYCGSERRVLRRVERIVDERTGRMLRFSRRSVILEGVSCSGCLSSYRMFCPRGVYPYWREAWLERVDPDGRQRAENSGHQRVTSLSNNGAIDPDGPGCPRG